MMSSSGSGTVRKKARFNKQSGFEPLSWLKSGGAYDMSGFHKCHLTIGSSVNCIRL